MKNIKYFSIVFLLYFYSNAQKAINQTPQAATTIVPVEKMIDYMEGTLGISGDLYFKDVNFLLDKYIGTWKGTNGNYNYEFRITKFTDAFDNHLEDILAIRYIISDNNGNIIENTISLTDDDPLVITGYYLVKNATNNYVLTYIGKNEKCGQKGMIQISTSKFVPTNPTQMKMNYYQDNIMLTEDCSTVATQIMPGKEGIILTKQ
jgi:hypothetical protein